MQLLLKYDKYLYQDYHKKKFDEYDFIWILIFMIPHIATYEIKSIFSSISHGEESCISPTFLFSHPPFLMHPVFL